CGDCRRARPRPRARARPEPRLSRSARSRSRSRPRPCPRPRPRARSRMTETADSEALAPAVLLRLMRLASPSLPVGGFSYSEGLEAAVEHGLVRDEAGTLAWLADQLRLALVPSELAVVAHAARAWDRDDL